MKKILGIVGIWVIAAGMLLGQGGGGALYQVNQLTAGTDFNAVLATAQTPGAVTLPGGAPGLLSLRSFGSGLPFEAAVNLSPVVPLGLGGVATPSGQIINLDLAAGFAFVNGGTAPAFVPFPGTITIPFTAPQPPFVASVQMIAIDPSHSDGFALSQASEMSSAYIGGYVYALPITGMPAMFLTDSGIQTGNLDGQLQLRIGSPDINGVRPVTAESFGWTSAGVPTAHGASGGVTFRMLSGIGSWNINTNAMNLSFQYEFSYARLDQMMPGPSAQGGTDDEDQNFKEIVQGFFSGAATGGVAGAALQLNGQWSATAGAAAAGGVAGAFASIAKTVPLRDLNGNLCPEVRRTRTRVVNVRPVFVRNNAADPAPTGTSLAAYRAVADAQWAKCCVQFNWLAATFVNNGTYKTMANSGAAAGRTQRNNLRAEVDATSANEEIEVFFVSNFTGPAHWAGDGVAIGNGARSAKIIVADAGAATAPGTLAHELGHALGHDHVNGTIMQPTGNDPMPPGAHPNVLTQALCQNAANPMLVQRTPETPCCFTWDPNP